MRAFHSAAAPQFPGLAQKTYAAHPVWKDSTRQPVRFAPLAKKEAVKIFHAARRFERQTRGRTVNARGVISRQDGRIGRAGLAVLHAMLFDFLNFRTGRLDPSYSSIAEKACVSTRTAARALVKLKAAGVLAWVRRVTVRKEEGGGFLMEQESNAYGVAPSSQWQGYRAPPDTPPPDPASWGASPPLPAFGVQAGDGAGRMRQLLEGSGDPLARSMARLAPPRSV